MVGEPVVENYLDHLPKYSVKKINYQKSTSGSNITNKDSRGLFDEKESQRCS